MNDRIATKLDPANDIILPEFKWDRYQFGNHRAVVVVDEDTWAARAEFQWRRRDPNPEQIDIILVSASTGEQITNAVRLHLDRFSADVIFEPISGPGEYFFYYLPYNGNPEAYYQKVEYRLREQTATTDWAERALREADDLPIARLAKLESVAEHHEFTELEMPATPDEIADLIKTSPNSGFMVFIERHDHPIRMRNFVPFAWIDRAMGTSNTIVAQPGEYVTFQLGIWASNRDLEQVDIAFHDLNGPVILSADRFTCFNLNGVDPSGKPFKKEIRIAKDRIQPMWCGLDLPLDTPAGDYQGTISVFSEGEEQLVSIVVNVAGEPILNHGDDIPQRLSRLRWLNSALAQESSVVRPFEPVAIEGKSLHILNRKVTIDDSGLPHSITVGEIEAMSAPIELRVNGSRVQAPALDCLYVEGEGKAVWNNDLAVPQAQLTIDGSLEFDGTLEYQIELTANSSAEWSNGVELELRIPRSIAKYMMGIGQKGGLRPSSYEWSWNPSNNQDSVWLGDVCAGLQLSLRDDSYRRPLNTNFYHQMPLLVPRSWAANPEKSGIRITEEGNEVKLLAYSGPIHVEEGDKLRFDFRLAITPFKPIDAKRHFEHRFYHAYRPIDAVDRSGANTLNVHHATGINPYINYPFLRPASMKDYADLAHARWMKFKIYYTVRELTTRAPELWALLSLDHEVFSPGPAGGYSWLQEHIGEDYIAAWYAPNVEDSSIVTNGISRWHNFYIEGLDWLALNVGIDGLYLDDIAFDRTTMKRIRRVLESRRPDPFIDVHSANQFNPKDGFASSANLYLEHFPFIDRIWLGEYFDYDSQPDYWLIEVSGIPFGIMGEMLEKGGNPYRGALFGMTCRMGWAEKPDPKPVWRIWDIFGIQDSKMIGWWEPDCPVKTDHPDVLATVYVKEEASLICLASWAPEAVSVRLSIDWQKLGLDPDFTLLVAPESKDFQPGATFAPDDLIPVEPGQGWMLYASHAAVVDEEEDA